MKIIWKPMEKYCLEKKNENDFGKAVRLHNK